MYERPDHYGELIRLWLSFPSWEGCFDALVIPACRVLVFPFRLKEHVKVTRQDNTTYSFLNTVVFVIYSMFTNFACLCENVCNTLGLVY